MAQPEVTRSGFEETTPAGHGDPTSWCLPVVNDAPLVLAGLEGSDVPPGTHRDPSASPSPSDRSRHPSRQPLDIAR